MNRLLILLLTIATLSFLVFGGITYAAPFTNGSFETASVNPGNGIIQRNSGDTSITGWTVLPTDIDYIGGTYWQHEDGSRSLDLNGDSPAGIAQTFDTVSGDQYQVTFWLAGNTQGLPTVKTLEVAATGNLAQDYTFDTTGHSNPSMGWTQETYSFTASGSSVTLSFTSKSPNPGGLPWYGPALDNVSVTDLGPPTTAVPEPSTMLLLGSGLIGLVGYGKRKFLKK